MIGKISIQTKMLLIIVPLMVVSTLILAIAGSLAPPAPLSPDMPCGMPHRMVSGWPCRSEFVPQWSGCGQDLLPPEV